MNVENLRWLGPPCIQLGSVKPTAPANGVTWPRVRQGHASPPQTRQSVPLFPLLAGGDPVGGTTRPLPRHSRHDDCPIDLFKAVVSRISDCAERTAAIETKVTLKGRYVGASDQRVEPRGMSSFGGSGRNRRLLRNGLSWSGAAPLIGSNSVTSAADIAVAQLIISAS